MPTINKEHKDRLFSFLFGSESNREWTLSLYNGVNGTSYVVRLPMPRLVTFYNGTEGEEDKILRLSDAFEPDGEAMEPDIEVRVRMININHGHNTELMKACRPLAEYAWLVDQIRENRKTGLEIGEAIDKAIDDMPMEYTIRMFLIGNRAEVKGMCITEYNEAETMKMFRKEGKEEGEEKLGRLIALLISNKRTDDAQRAAVDKEIRAALYKEFNII